MKSIKVKSASERANELRRDPEAYFESVRVEAREAARASMSRRRTRKPLFRWPWQRSKEPK